MKLTLVQILAFVFLLISCGEQEIAPAPETQAPQRMACEKVDFATINGWGKDRFFEAYQTYRKTCERLKYLKSEFLGTAELKISTADYLAACQKLPDNPAEFKRFLEENFSPCLVTYDGKAEGKFTSYYEAEIEASLHKSEVYNSPIYGRPNDLIEFNPKDFDLSMPDKRLVGRVENNKLVPYFARADIENNGIDAPVILYGNDAVDIYVMQIQGSAVAKLEDGSRVRIGFADTNGRPFRGIGSILLENKVIKQGQASMGKIKEWLKANPQIAGKYLNQNQRYVFHRLIDAEGPLGALGVPLDAGRSLAVDKSFIPLGTVLWLETAGPNKEPIEKLVIAQDIGGAIKGAVRGDYFWGSGGDDVLALAGKMNSQGRYFVLLPKKGESENGKKTY